MLDYILTMELGFVIYLLYKIAPFTNKQLNQIQSDQSKIYKFIVEQHELLTVRYELLAKQYKTLESKLDSMLDMTYESDEIIEDNEIKEHNETKDTLGESFKSIEDKYNVVVDESSSSSSSSSEDDDELTEEKIDMMNALKIL